MTPAVHLASRYFGSLSRRPPDPAREAWAVAHLSAGEQEIWWRMSTADRRHAVAVAGRVAAGLDEPDRPVVAAALLHDCGKVDCGLGPNGRALATVVAAVAGRSRVSRSGGRFGRYLRHAAIGAALLEQAGSDPLTIAWAREHHLPEGAWTVEPQLGAALKAADDD
jgi:hypothetical protein